MNEKTRFDTNQKKKFWLYVDKSNDCWLWNGAKTGAGYGAFYLNTDGKTYLAHKLSFWLYTGVMHKGRDIQLDHLCRVRTCVNPLHLEPVSIKENLLRGNGICALNSRKKHCKRGHEFNKTNTRFRPTGGRSCRKCACIIAKRSRERSKDVSQKRR